MANRTLEIDHEARLGQLSPDWREWRVIIGPKAWTVYAELRKPEYDGALVDFTLFCRLLGMSKTAVLASLEALDEQGFITISEE